MTPGLYHVDVIVPDGTNSFNLIMNADGLDTQSTMNTNRSIVRDVLSRPIGTGAAPNEAHVPVYYPSVTEPQQARGGSVRRLRRYRVLPREPPGEARYYRSGRASRTVLSYLFSTAPMPICCVTPSSSTSWRATWHLPPPAMRAT